MLDRATLIAAIVGPLFLGALVVTAIMADRQTRTVTTVRYVTETQYVTVAKPARTVYVERIVEKVVEVPVETGVQEPSVVVTELPQGTVPPVTPPPPEPVVVPQEPPPVVIAAVCEHRGQGHGKQVGVCRKQGFP